jgi:carbamoyltransferase
MAAVLGLNCYKHDAAAALLVDGKLVAAAEEERFRRSKHYSGYPAMAIEYSLKQAGMEARDLDAVAFYMLPGLVARENFAYSRHYVFEKGGREFLLAQMAGARKMARIGCVVREHLGPGLRAGIHFVRHHVAHARAAAFCSGFDSCAVLTMDGVGEIDTSLLGFFDGNRLTSISGSRYPNSPGIYYGALTRHLGFEPDSDEYKVMGLASYGQPEFADLFRRMISTPGGGRIHLNCGMMNPHRGIHFARYSQAVMSVIGPARDPEEPVEPRHENVASSAQLVLEELGLALAKYLREKTGKDKLVISGGVGLNCVMNGRIEREAGFSEIYPLPAPHDAGTSIGAALDIHIRLFPGVPLEPPADMYLGPSYSDKAVEASLSGSKITYARPEKLADVAARLVEKGMVVALYQGRMEFGPRALGNRSILADPRRADMKDIVNSVVKQREPFRPFAPSCMEERAGEYFEGCTRSRYMISTYNVIPSMAQKIPAVTHVDGTSRVQTVPREMNPFYWEIIEAFARRTGVPVVLNTSFNVKGEAIVESPTDAVRCFYGTGLDALVIPPFLVAKRSAVEALKDKTQG